MQLSCHFFLQRILLQVIPGEKKKARKKKEDNEIYVVITVTHLATHSLIQKYVYITNTHTRRACERRHFLKWPLLRSAVLAFTAATHSKQCCVVTNKEEKEQSEGEEEREEEELVQSWCRSSRQRPPSPHAALCFLMTSAFEVFLHLVFYYFAGGCSFPFFCQGGSQMWVKEKVEMKKTGDCFRCRFSKDFFKMLTLLPGHWNCFNNTQSGLSRLKSTLQTISSQCAVVTSHWKTSYCTFPMLGSWNVKTQQTSGGTGSVCCNSKCLQSQCKHFCNSAKVDSW